MHRAAVIAFLLLVLMSAAAPWLSPHDPSTQYRDFPHAGPGLKFPLGTDEYGRDHLSRLLHAGRWSLLAGALATLLSLSAGTLLGLAAAGGGKAVETVILWFADLSLSLPWLYLLFAVRGLLPLSMAPETAFLAILSLVGLLGWAVPARLVRAAALGVLTQDYVLAARGFGASRAYILLRHVLPALGPVLLPQVFVLMPQYVLAESTLSFLGLGLGEPTPTWGTMLASMRENLPSGVAPEMLAPAVLIIVLTLSSDILAGKRFRSS
ncbi:MAG: ABC transporter permease [Bryobacteraceae bacterium]|nr:ABC transporter permease [Bryobacteraceae bacterium]